MLFVRHDKCKIFEFDFFLYKRMCPHYYINFAVFYFFVFFFLLRCRHGTYKHSHSYSKFVKNLTK